MTACGMLETDRILVTGAGGFVGRHVIANLTVGAPRVTAMLGPPGSGFRRPPGVDASVEADICNERIVQDLVDGADTVVHLAGPPSVAQSFDEPATFARIHVEGTATLLLAAMRSTCRRVIYISSAEVYGHGKHDFAREDHALEARSPYAACKIAAEQLLSTLAHCYGRVVVILRPFSLYGPGAPSTSVLAQLIAQASAREALTLRDPRPVRDFCFITDLAEAVRRACELPLSPGVHYFNIGTMRGTSTGQLARMLLSTLASDLPLLISPVGARPHRADIIRLVADNSRAEAVLGWRPRVRLEDGLRMLLKATP